MRVIDAMRRVERHRFIADDLQDEAYEDRPLPIGFGQTISQPYIVALMAQLAEISSEGRVLDIGAGCGYQAAVLSLLAKEVVSIEIHPELAISAQQRLQELRYHNVLVRHADGYHGAAEQAPYDAIVSAAAPERIPTALYDQLAIGGRLIIPIGKERQTLMLVHRSSKIGYDKRKIARVAFVPMLSKPGMQ